MTGERKVFKIAELTRLIKNQLESSFGNIWVEGEVSNVRRPASGHYYFTIKDESSQISAVLFRGNQSGLKFQLKDGMLVQAFGQVSVYERSGSYQIIVRQMEEGGKGSLQAAFEALKKRLHAEGLFDEKRKRALPVLPRRIGVVTSPTGAAIRDILKVISRRFPNLQVVIAPARVQGNEAAAEVAEGIRMLNRLGGFDAMIVGRGGGSLEDLWCFNEEEVARAIADSAIPVISAVGHEIDFTISDFVADLRAATPSAAAELLTGQKELMEQRLEEMKIRIARSLKESMQDARHRLLTAAGNPVFVEPKHAVDRYRQRMQEIWLRIEHSTSDRVREVQQRLDDASLTASRSMQERVTSGSQDLRRLQSQLRALSPNAVLERGFSITRGEDGKIIRKKTDAKSGDHILTQLSDGSVESEVI